jgi:hypothetical protein
MNLLRLTEYCISQFTLKRSRVQLQQNILNVFSLGLSGFMPKYQTFRVEKLTKLFITFK